MWCQLIPQEDIQLLLLIKAQENPKISLYVYLYGTQNYSVLTFVPTGMEEMIHKNPSQQKKCRTMQEGVCDRHIKRALPVLEPMGEGAYG